MDNQLTFLTSDDQILKAPLGLKAMCGLLRNNDFPNNEINLKEVCSSKYLSLLLYYCKNHQYINPEPIPVPITTQFIKLPKYDDEFVKALNFDDLVELLLIATKLQCNALEDLCYAQMAVIMRNTPTEDLKKGFNIKDNEFNAEDFLNIKTKFPNIMTISEVRENDFGFKLNK